MTFYYDNAIGSGDKTIICRSISRVMIAKVCKLLNIEWSLQFYMGRSSDDREGYLDDVLEYLHVTNSDFEWDEETGILQLNMQLPTEKVEGLVDSLCEQWSEYMFNEIEDVETGEPVEFATYNDKGVALYMKYYRGIPCRFFKEYYEMILRKGIENNDK